MDKTLTLCLDRRKVARGPPSYTIKCNNVVLYIFIKNNAMKILKCKSV